MKGKRVPEVEAGQDTLADSKTHLNSPAVTKNASKNKATQANSPKMAAWFQKAHMGHTR